MAARTRSGSKPLPDLAWVVRPGEDNEELRYSLRSVAANATGFRQVWIVGTVPSWLAVGPGFDDVHAMPLDPAPEKFANQRQSLEALAGSGDVADQVVIFNDDHFLMDPIAAWPAFHLGPTSAYLRHLAKLGTVPARNTWARAVERTAAWMDAQGHGDVLCYESHTPLLFDRQRLADALSAYPEGEPLAYPQLYAVAGAGGEGVDAGNAKVKDLGWRELNRKIAQPMPYLSSNDQSFAEGIVGGYVRGAFRERSPYEKG